MPRTFTLTREHSRAITNAFTRPSMEHMVIPFRLAFSKLVKYAGLCSIVVW